MGNTLFYCTPVHWLITTARSLGCKMIHVLQSYWHRPAHQDWLSLTRFTIISAPDDGDGDNGGDRRRKLVQVNCLLFMWHLFMATRLGWSAMIDTNYHHLMGHSLNHAGNAVCLIQVLGGLGLTQAALLRLTCSCLASKGNWSFMEKDFLKTTDRHCECQLTSRLMHAATILMLVSTITVTCLILSAMFAGNVLQSTNQFQVLCWTFWWIIDMVMCVTTSIDLVMFPSSWLLLGTVYRMRLNALAKVIACQPRNGSSSSIYFVRRSLTSLEEFASSVKQTLGSIHFVQSVLTTPIMCLVIFISMYSDNDFYRNFMPLVGLGVGLFPFALQALAAVITATSEQVFHQLALMTGRTSGLMPLKSRQLLLIMMQETGCQEQRLALYSLVGDKYTISAFTRNVMETFVHLSLLITFSGYLLHDRS